MKALFMTVVIVLGLSQIAAAACSILHKEKTQIGDYEGIKGV